MRRSKDQLIPHTGTKWVAKEHTPTGTNNTDIFTVFGVSLRGGTYVQLTTAKLTGGIWEIPVDLFWETFAEVEPEPTLQSVSEAYARGMAELRRLEHARQAAQDNLRDVVALHREAESACERVRQQYYWFVDSVVIDRSKEIEAEEIQ